MGPTSLKHWWIDIIWCRPVYTLKADAISAFTFNGFAIPMLPCVLLNTNNAGLENACHRHEMASMWSCSKHRQGIYHDQLSMQWYSHAIGPVVIGLTLRGWVTHICISKLNIIGSDNGLSPGRHQAIIWTNAGILLIWPWGKLKWNIN